MLDPSMPRLTRTIIYIPFFFIDTATTEIYTLSLHDALPISEGDCGGHGAGGEGVGAVECVGQEHPGAEAGGGERSEEHTSELQSLTNLVCRLLLEKKN